MQNDDECGDQLQGVSEGSAVELLHCSSRPLGRHLRMHTASDASPVIILDQTCTDSDLKKCCLCIPQP